MKKIIIKKTIATIFIASSFTFFSFAQKAESVKTAEPESFSVSIFKQIKNILNVSTTKDKDLRLEKISEKQESTENTKQDIVAASSTSNYSTSTTVACEAQNKINIKKEKINKQIKNQIQDKNKLVENLLKIAAFEKGDSQKIIEDKILDIEEMVSDVIKDQKNLIEAIVINYDSVCDSTQTSFKSIARLSYYAPTNTGIGTDTEEIKESSKIKIKKIEADIIKKNKSINSLIKVELKNTLESLN